MLCTQEVSIKVDRRRPYTITSTSVAESLEFPYRYATQLKLMVSAPFLSGMRR